MATGETGYLERYLSRRALSAGMNKAKKGFFSAHKKGLIFILEVIAAIILLWFFVATVSYMQSTPKCERLGTCVVGSQR